MTKRTKRILTGVTIGFGIIAIAVWVWSYAQMREVRGSLLEFGEALIVEDYSRAYGLTSTRLRAVTDEAAFKTIHQGLVARYGKCKDISVGNQEVNYNASGWSATADVNLTFDRGSVPFVFSLDSEDDHWVVVSYLEQ